MPNRLRPKPTQIAGFVQLAFALALVILLGVALWRFVEIAGRLPGGASRYSYMPVAMVGVMAIALWRAFRALQKIRGGGPSP